MKDEDARIVQAIFRERIRQDQKWGEQNHPDGTGGSVYISGRSAYARDLADDMRTSCQGAAGNKVLTWRHILREEVYEAFAEEDEAKLEVELIQAAAVIVQWIQAIHRRQDKRNKTRNQCYCGGPEEQVYGHTSGTGLYCRDDPKKGM